MSVLKIHQTGQVSLENTVTLDGELLPLSELIFEMSAGKIPHLILKDAPQSVILCNEIEEITIEVRYK